MISKSIQTVLLCVFVLLTSTLTFAQDDRPTHKFNRQWLEEKAKELAAKEFVEPKLAPDSPLNNLNYDDYRKIQFQRGASVWKNEDRNFRLSPMHPGFLFKTPVKLNLVVGGTSRRILYTSDIFNYDKEQKAAKETQAEGYSGFKLTTPINKPDVWDEFLVYQGGTYFRGLGKDNWYGLSARGLAVNTAKPTGEEFPVFTEFWIERPKEQGQSIVIHALLESASLTGAFTFKATPGENTEIEVNSALYPRKQIDSFGIGPLTSMFLYNGVNRTRFDDTRPAVHDSDGLFMINSQNERIWRPLTNPRKLQVSAFGDKTLKGFGLFQRHRKFTDFEDMEAHYEARPSAWVEPIGNWGPGHVELVEIPTNSEIHDNIVAFWQPSEPMKANRAYSFQYKISWGSVFALEDKGGRILSTATGKALGSETVRDFVIDYSSLNLPDDVVVSASASTGKIVGTIQKFMDKTGLYRVVVKFEPGREDLSELRVSLSSKDKAWGETWLYRWNR
ncbi:glucan biosynthesis protein [Flavobacterium sp. W21_SRS_FM6]|uniref:glucan biosynthesis protein n=1 Tax=Flavobacterium sp. W21_SRS_FM6 TaxID=3240268 RepID=UPI003F8F6A9F